jgi:hypothetical protein
MFLMVVLISFNVADFIFEEGVVKLFDFHLFASNCRNGVALANSEFGWLVFSWIEDSFAHQFNWERKIAQGQRGDFMNLSYNFRAKSHCDCAVTFGSDPN